MNHEPAEMEAMLLSDISPRPSVSSPSVSSEEAEDLELNSKGAIDHTDSALEYRTPASVKYTWLCGHLGFGMLLTISNKYVLNMVDTHHQSLLLWSESRLKEKLIVRYSFRVLGS